MNVNIYLDNAVGAGGEHINTLETIERNGHDRTF